MPEFVEAARVDQIPPGTGTTIKVADKEIAIFNVDGNFYAIGDSCAHAGASSGRQAERQDCYLSCARPSIRCDDRPGYHWRIRSCVISGEDCGREDSNRSRLEAALVATAKEDRFRVIEGKSIMATKATRKWMRRPIAPRNGSVGRRAGNAARMGSRVGRDLRENDDEPWTSTVLPRKTVELIGVALNAACTNLNPDGTRRHIRAALRAGASREEILMVLKMASVLAIHSCSLGAPILLEEAKAAGIKPSPNRRSQPRPATRYARSANGMTHGILLSS